MRRVDEDVLLQRLEPAGAPGFELLPDLLGFAVARHDDVHMVPAAIDGVDSRLPHPAMIGNVNPTSRCWSWSRRQASSVRRAYASRLRAGSGSRRPVAVLDPPAPIAGQPGAVRWPGQKRGQGFGQRRFSIMFLGLFIGESRWFIDFLS